MQRPAMQRRRAELSVLEVVYRPGPASAPRTVDLSLAAVQGDGSVALWSRTDGCVRIPDHALEGARDIIQRAIDARR